jgi:hypothetical protein
MCENRQTGKQENRKFGLRKAGFLLPAFLLLCFPVFLPGCQTVLVEQQLTENLAGNGVDQQMEFWHTLATRKLTSNDEAFHALLLYVDQTDEAETYDQRVASLKSRNMLPASFDEPADVAVTRGTLSVAIVKILQLKGGVVMQLFGASPRYATRELQYVGLYPDSSPHQTFSGDQFVSIIGRIEDYQRLNPFEVSGGNANSQPKVGGAG